MWLEEEDEDNLCQLRLINNLATEEMDADLLLAHTKITSLGQFPLTSKVVLKKRDPAWRTRHNA